jgi:hypothetical protein
LLAPPGLRRRPGDPPQQVIDGQPLGLGNLANRIAQAIGDRGQVIFLGRWRILGQVPAHIVALPGLDQIRPFPIPQPPGNPLRRYQMYPPQ